MNANLPPPIYSDDKYDADEAGAFFAGADDAAAMIDGFPPIWPVACPNPENTGPAGAGAGAATAGDGET